MSALLEEQPKYREVMIVKVDWDKHGKGDIVRDLKVPRRSTLVMFNGGKEVGRVVARVDKASIGALFEATVS